jgi:hypothetical protein
MVVEVVSDLEQFVITIRVGTILVNLILMPFKNVVHVFRPA